MPKFKERWIDSKNKEEFAKLGFSLGNEGKGKNI